MSERGAVVAYEFCAATGYFRPPGCYRLLIYIKLVPPMRVKILLHILILLPCLHLAAQQDKRVEKKAAKYFDEALAYKAKKQYAEACASMELSIAEGLVNEDAYSMLGQWYFEGHEFEKAANIFRKGSVSFVNGRMRFAKPLTRSLIYAGNPDEALQLINNYATIRDSAEWNALRVKAEFVKGAMMHSWGVWPQNLGQRVNSPAPELFPSMAVDTQYMFFTRRVNNVDEDLYIARADSCGGWLRADNVGEPTNTPNQESSQFVSADGHYLFFSRNENRSENGWDEGGCDLFMAYRVTFDAPWTQPTPFGRTINTPDYQGQPSLSPDNRELYFVSDKAGGMGGYDIWISRFENGLWQLPENAGPGVNTAGNETTPFIAADNKTLLFASDTRAGFGGTDIFVSRRRTPTDKWGVAENMGYPINTAHDEKSEYVTLDGKRMYFASDRNGPAGNYDIYQVPLPGVMSPIPVSYMYGVVYDSISRERLNSAEIFICKAATGDTLYELRSNRGDATYVITLEPEKTYAVHVGRMGYRPVSDTVLFGKEFTSRPMNHNVPMLTLDYNPIKPIKDTVIATVNFDVNVAELSAADKASLQAAVSAWLEEKGIVVYVNAYTDNTGTPMINEELSARRAQTVANEVIALGMPEESVTAKGWGEANAIASNDTEEGRRKNRRVEIIVKR